MKDLMSKSWFKYVPFLVIFIPCCILICIGYTGENIFQITIPILDSPKRTRLITVIGIGVGVFHYVYHVRKKNETGIPWANILISLSKSLFSGIGYSIIVNGALNVGVGLLKEKFTGHKFFTDSSLIDFVSFGVMALVIVLLGCFEIWKMIKEAAFKASHTVKTPVADEAKNRREGNG